MIEQTIQHEIDLLNNAIKWFTLTLHRQREKWKLMIIDHATNLYTPLIIDKMSVIEKWLNNVIMKSQEFWYSIDTLLLYLKQ